MARVMKDSGVEWIGEIPKQWELKRLKALLVERKEKNDPVKTNFILSLGSNYGVIPYSEKEGGGNKAKEDYSAYNLAYPNDIVMNSMNIISGAVGISKYYGCVSPVYFVLYARNGNVNINYYNYMFQSKAFQRSLLGLGNGILIKESSNGNFNTVRMRIPIGKLNVLLLPNPELKEQQRIASFLDSKCQEIDNVLAKTRSSIEEYKKLKQAIITKAVTKGIRKNRKMKDSGIEWIGEIPEEWPLYISRFCIDYIGDVDHYMPESIDAGVPYIMTGDLKDKISKIDFKQCKQISFDDYKKLSNKIVAEKGDIILARYATIGTTCYVDIDSEFIVSYSCVIIKLDKTKLRGYYLFYYFKSLMFIEETIRLAKSNTQSNLGIEELYSFRIPLPDLTEQQIIIDYLDLKCSELDNLIKKKEQLISELESYKKSLIYEYVTGKKEVPMA